MVTISSKIIKKQPNFWSAALFHPTDAVEDPWGKRIIDRLARDKSIHTIRIYSMFEDIVYLGEDGELCYDFRVSDLRLDYLTSLGFNLLIAYGGMPDCIATSTALKSSMSKNKTRYKGKMWNTSPPKDYSLWEEVCYEYTKHNIERYGEDVVARWELQCFNESDVTSFFMGDIPEDDWEPRCAEYCKLYEAYERGIRRASEKMTIGGPALAHRQDFFGRFLDYVKERGLRLDFISLHNYGTMPQELNRGTRRIAVENNLKRHRKYINTAKEHGFGDAEIVVDEWGFATGGFLNKEECPSLMFRETEKFAAYYVKLIYEFIKNDFNIKTLMICLSGQHEMVEDFTGFRNFFTLNFIAKPIYNAHLLASRLGDKLLDYTADNENVFVIPTERAGGSRAIMLTYCSENFEYDLPETTENLILDGCKNGSEVEIYKIDKNTTNPYTLAQKINALTNPTKDQIRILQNEGTLKSERVKYNRGIELTLTPNCTYFISAK